MNEPALSIRGLSKRYHLGTIGCHTLVDEAERVWHRLRGRDPRLHMGRINPHAMGHDAPGVSPERTDRDEFWALRDVSFDVHPGDVVGILGRNGAGKSTLLKILSRITEPTAGEVFIKGRIGSLLEVGTGFHPELTGRENIFMNGTILGMKTREIAARFDEIVAFAEIEKFIDTPVKRYSSGMYVRLAFAVAAHLEPEILLVDEVLAVGDAVFQRKCLGKMDDVAKQGRTVLFVSHNLPAVQTLCPRSVLLAQGRLAMQGDTGAVLDAYTGGGGHQGCAEWRADAASPTQTGFARVRLTQQGCDTAQVRISQPFQVDIQLQPGSACERHMVSLQIETEDGEVVHHGADLYLDENSNRWRTGHRRAVIPAHGLRPGKYTLSLWLHHPKNKIADHLGRVLCWEVVADGPGMMLYPSDKWHGATGPGFIQWVPCGEAGNPLEEGGPFHG